jgi:putative resolvase
VDVTYRTAIRWWQNGHIKGYQLPSATIVVTEGEAHKASKPDELVAIYTRVSDHAHRANLERRARRLEDDCVAKGYRVYRVGKEIDSGGES